MNKALLVPFLLIALKAQAATCDFTVHTSDSAATVQGYVNSATSGQTICFDAGTHTWTAGINVSKQITLTGPDAPVGQPTAIISGGQQTLSGELAKGQMFNLVSDGKGSAGTDTGVADHNTLTIKNLGLVFDNVLQASSGQIIAIRGTARYHLCPTGAGTCTAGQPAGGVRISNIHFTAKNPTSAMVSNAILIEDWNSGVIDHCYFDFGLNTGSKAVVDVGGPSSAPGIRTSPSFYTIHGNTIQPAGGIYSASVPHNWGTIGGAIDTTGPWNLGNVNEDDQWYLEDCIFEKRALGGVSVSDNTSATTGAGGRFVFRHNCLWLQMSGHGFGESGFANSTAFVEAYSNFFRWPYGSTPTGTAAFTNHNNRTGAWVVFNERYQDEKDVNVSVAPSLYRFANVGTPNMIGVADGTNFFDNNHRGSLSWTSPTTGHSYGPITPVESIADTRVGDVYAKSNGPSDTGVITPAVNTNTANNVTLRSTFFAGADADKFVGFTLRNKTKLPAPSTGGQTAGGTQGSQLSGIIKSSTAANGTNDITFVLQAWAVSSPTNYLLMDATDQWEMRYIDEAIGMPGYGKLHGQLTGNDLQGSGGSKPPFDMIHWLTCASVSGAVAGDPGNIGGVCTGAQKNQYWAGQDQEGIWAWNCLYRKTSIVNKNWAAAEPNLHPSFYRFMPGGLHGMSFSSDGLTGSGHTGPKPSYPQVNMTGFTTAQKDAYGRIGPDWNSGTFGGRYADGTPVMVDNSNGAPAPNPCPSGMTCVTVPNSIPRNAVGGVYGTSGSGVPNAGLTDSDIYGAPYPHPLVSGVVISAPTFTSLSVTTFTGGTKAADCASTPVYNCFKVTTSGWAGAGTSTTYSIFSGSLPSNVSLTSSGGIGTLSGTANGASTATFTIRATNGSETKDQSFTLAIQTVDNKPTASITTAKTSFTTAETVYITAATSDAEGPVAKVDFYSGTTKIGTINNPASSEVFGWNTSSSPVPLTTGTFVLKAISTDGAGQASNDSNTITITVTNPLASPTPAVIQIK